MIKVSPGYARVQKQTSLPTNTIKNVRVRLLKVTSSETFLLEPIDSNKRYILVAKCLAKNNHNKYFVQVLNQ